MLNANTRSLILQTIQVGADGNFNEDGNYRISGVKSAGSAVRMEFSNPVGSMTGKLFPTGNRSEELLVTSHYIASPFIANVTLIDAANPFVFVDSASLPEICLNTGFDSDMSLAVVEAIRREGAIRLGLAVSAEQAALTQGTPKIALLSSPSKVSSPNANAVSHSQTPDIQVLSYSMGKVHPSFQLTGAVTLGVAVTYEATTASRLANKSAMRYVSANVARSQDACATEGESLYAKRQVRGPRKVVISHRSGQIEIEVEGTQGGSAAYVTAFRTTRRLFEGSVWCSI